MEQNEIMEKYLELQEILKEKELQLEAFKTQVEDFKVKEDNYINTVSNLRDTNQKLFLKVAQPVNHEEPVTQAAEAKTETVVSWDELVSLF